MSKDLSLFVHWQEPVTRRWHVVGRLTRSEELYRFVYTRGALASDRFVPFGRMVALRQEYQSDELFPLFNNRILPRSRPEYGNYLEWLALDEKNVDPLVILGRSGGLRGTDTLAMYPAPAPDKNRMYHVTFFCHGMRYIGKTSGDAVWGLNSGDRLYPMHDMQNSWDRNALALRTTDPARMIGYCPRFFANDFRVLLRKHPKDAVITVVRVNHDAPIDFRLLCEMRSPWPRAFKACADEEYQSIAKKRSASPAKKARLAKAKAR